MAEESNNSQSDAYDEMRRSPESDRTPGFLGGTGDSEGKKNNSNKSSKKQKRSDARDNAQGELNDFEADAANQGEEGGFYKGDGTAADAREKENIGIGPRGNKTWGYYRHKIKESKKNKGKNGSGGGLSKGLPATITGFMLLIALFGCVSFSTISNQLVAWKENIFRHDRGTAVIARRSNVLFRRLLGDTSDGNRYKISSKLSKKLSAKGIEYVTTEDTDGKKLKMLVFEDSDGTYKAVVASDADVPRANALAGTEIEVGGKKVKLGDSSMTFDNARSKNKVFNQNYSEATISFTGKVAGWFDSMADSLLERIIGPKPRDQLGGVEPDKVENELTKNATTEMNETKLEDTSKEKSEGEGGGEDGKTKTFPDGEGGETNAQKIIESDDSIKINNPDSESVATKLKAKAQKVAAIGASVSCGVLRGVGAISMAVGAIQTMNVINYAAKLLETADRIKSGDGDSTTNEVLNLLNTDSKAEAYDIDGNPVEYNDKFNESPGYNDVFASKSVINPNDPSALLVNRELANKNALKNAGISSLLAEFLAGAGTLGAGVAAFRVCNGIQIVTGLIDAAMDVVAIFTAGIAKGIKQIIKGAIEGAVLAAVMALVGVVIAAITPVVTQWAAANIPDILLGRNGGFAARSGAHSIIDKKLQQATGMSASVENAVKTYGLTLDVEREWASYDRATLSPFDITSPYTFLGSLYSSMIPIINQSSGGAVVSTVSSIANLTKSSALALVDQSASAASETGDFALSLAEEGNCGFLDSVGVAGDFACNKYSGAYVDEVNNMDPYENEQAMYGYDSFAGVDAYGNPQIREGSDYAKYIVACVTNDAQPGTMSSVVQGYIEEHTTTDDAVANGLIGFASNFVPGEGFLDAASGFEQAGNIVWNSNLACTGNSGDPHIDEEAAHFSTYNLDQWSYYDMGVSESNSTVSFLEKYYEEHPLDNSYEGKIARFSGMSKEDVSNTLALIEYYQYISDYDPTERYAFGEPAVKEDNTLKFDNDNVVAADAVLLNTISYADVRNRSFAA